MRKLKGFVWVFLVLVQYFWLFAFAYELPPGDELIQDVGEELLVLEETIPEDVFIP